MKKILLLITLMVGLNHLNAQELIGKSKYEIKAEFIKTYNASLQGKPGLAVNVDSITTDVYLFNSQEICFEYLRIFITTDTKIIDNYLSGFHRKNMWCGDRKNTEAFYTDTWYDDNRELVANVIKLSESVWKITFHRKS